MESIEKIGEKEEQEASGSVEIQVKTEETEKCEETAEGVMEKEIKHEAVECIKAEVQSDVEAEVSKTLPDITLADVRKAKSIASVASSDAGDLSALSDSDCSDFEPIVSDPDSDVEFEQYLKESATRRQKNYIREHCWNMETKRSKKEPKSDRIDNEYEGLPDFEKLTISCPETAKLAKFGCVQSVVGCIAMIQPDASVSQILDLESVVFDKEGKFLGSVFDVIGTVKEALYCIRFGSKTEASEIPVGQEVFYAPTVEDFTKKLIDSNLAGAWNKEAVESDEDEAVFSDDEQEKAYRNKRNAAKNVENVGRKRNHNRSVRFEEPGGESHRGGGRGRGGPNRGFRGRGRGFQWQQRSTMDTFSKPSGSDPSGPIQVPDMAKQNQKPAQSTSDNPYAEFGCYDNRR